MAGCGRLLLLMPALNWWVALATYTCIGPWQTSLKGQLGILYTQHETPQLPVPSMIFWKLNLKPGKAVFPKSINSVDFWGS